MHAYKYDKTKFSCLTQFLSKNPHLLKKRFIEKWFAGQCINLLASICHKNREEIGDEIPYSEQECLFELVNRSHLPQSIHYPLKMIVSFFQKKINFVGEALFLPKSSLMTVGRIQIRGH